MNNKPTKFLKNQHFERSAISFFMVLLMAFSLFPEGFGVAFADEPDNATLDENNSAPNDDKEYIEQGESAVSNDGQSDSDSEIINDSTPETTASSGIEPLATAIPDLCTISSVISIGQVFDIPGASKDDQTQVQLWVGNTTPAQRFRFVQNNDDTYTIINVNSQKALDVRLGQAFSGAIVWQYTQNGTDAQKWYITEYENGFKIASKVNRNYCLDLPGAQTANGTKLQLHNDNGTPAQRFAFNRVSRSIEDGAYIINSVANTNLVIDISGGSLTSDANVQYHTNNQSLAQRFLIVYDARTGYYSINNTKSNMMIDLAWGSLDNGARIHTWPMNDTNAQKWSIARVANGNYTITSAHSNKVLGSYAETITNGTPLQATVWSGAANQQWIFKVSQTTDNGSFQIRAGVGTVIDVRGNGQTNGSQVWAFQANKTTAQKFYLWYVSNGYFKIEGIGSGKLVTAEGNNIILYEDRSLDRQLWKLEPAGNGFFFALNKESGRALDVVGGSSVSGTDLQVFPLNRTAAQQWKFESIVPLADGLYMVRTSADQSRVLDIRNNSSENGTRLQVYSDNGTIAQMFRFVNTGGVDFQITCLNSNKSLDVDRGITNPKGVVHLWTTVPNSPNKNQVWRIEYAGNTSYRIFSQVGNGNSCLTIEGDIASDVPVCPQNGSISQLFKLTSLGNTAYVPLNMTVSTMIAWQRAGNQYIDTITDQQLRDVIDPVEAMKNYSFPGHSTYYYGELQFIDLRRYTGMTAAQVDDIINSHSASHSTMRGMGYAFVQASRTYNLNESYLLAHCALESGWGSSSLSQGYQYNGTDLVDGRTWPAGTYYNFFGIGAYDSGPLSGGRAYAIKNGWNSIEKAIIGGAQWIVEGYVYRDAYGQPYGQPTLYAMKWDYNRSNSTSSYGWHQYATDHLWARKIARMMGDFYNRFGLKPEFTYIIPQYRS